MLRLFEYSYLGTQNARCASGGVYRAAWRPHEDRNNESQFRIVKLLVVLNVIRREFYLGLGEYVKC